MKLPENTQPGNCSYRNCVYFRYHVNMSCRCCSLLLPLLISFVVYFGFIFFPLRFCSGCVTRFFYAPYFLTLGSFHSFEENYIYFMYNINDVSVFNIASWILNDNVMLSVHLFDYCVNFALLYMQLIGNPLTGNPHTGNPITGNPLTGNPFTGKPLTGILL